MKVTNTNIGRMIENAARKVAQIYRQNGRTFGYHLASVGVSTLAGAANAGCLETQGCSPGVNSSVTTAVGAGSYWASFIGLLAKSERDSMKGEQGIYDPRKVRSAIAKYAAFMGIGELLYTGVRGIVQYQLQKRCEVDAATASVLTDLTCAMAYGLLVPPINHILRRRDSKLENIAQGVKG